MSYVKQNFIDGQVLKAEHLCCIEDCLCDIEGRMDELKETGGISSSDLLVVTAGEDGKPSHSATEIQNAVADGKYPVFVLSHYFLPNYHVNPDPNYITFGGLIYEAYDDDPEFYYVSITVGSKSDIIERFTKIPMPKTPGDDLGMSGPTQSGNTQFFIVSMTDDYYPTHSAAEITAAAAEGEIPIFVVPDIMGSRYIMTEWSASGDGSVVLFSGFANRYPEESGLQTVLYEDTVTIMTKDEPVQWSFLKIDGGDDGDVDFVVQDTPPEDTSVLWVDPTDNTADSGSGVESVKWEKLDYIETTEEVTTLMRDKYLDGTQYNLSAVKVIAKYPYPIPTIGTNLNVFNNNKTLGTITLSIDADGREGTTYVGTGIYQVKPVSGLYEFIGAKGRQGGDMNVSYPPNGGYQFVSTDNKIDKINLTAWLNTIPAGTKVEIWGVRA